MEVEPLNRQLINNLQRFLYVGQETPKYFPGCWKSHKYYELDKLLALDKLFELNKDRKDVIDIILKVYEQNYYTRFEPLVFALAKCLLLGGPAVKEAAYKAVLTICKTSQELMIFIQFTRKFKTGSGQGWCKTVRNWYLAKDPKELAREVSRVKGRHGTSHKILFKKSHINVSQNDPARNAIVLYTLYGLKKAKQMLANHAEVDDIFAILKIGDDLRCCESEEDAAKMLKSNKFGLDFIPGQFLTSQDLWDAVIPQLTLKELLHNLLRIHNFGFLTMDSTTTNIVLAHLKNKNAMKTSRCPAIDFYVAYHNYLHRYKPMKHEKEKHYKQKESRRRLRQTCVDGVWKWISDKRHPKEIKIWGIDLPPNSLILNTLLTQIQDTLKYANVHATKLNYMITMDMRNHMFDGYHYSKPPNPKKAKVEPSVESSEPEESTDTETPAAPKNKKRLKAEIFNNKYIIPGNAAATLAMQLLLREKNVTLAVFTDDGVEIKQLSKKLTLADFEKNLRDSKKLGRVQLDAPIKWAKSKKKNIDVFINMVDRTTRYMELDIMDRGGRGDGGRYGPPPKADSEKIDHCPVRALEEFRRANGQPNSKLVVMSLASHRVNTMNENHEGVLDIVGFDQHVLDVIDAFSLGYFK